MGRPHAQQYNANAKWTQWYYVGFGLIWLCLDIFYLLVFCLYVMVSDLMFLWVLCVFLLLSFYTDRVLFVRLVFCLFVFWKEREGERRCGVGWVHAIALRMNFEPCCVGSHWSSNSENSLENKPLSVLIRDRLDLVNPWPCLWGTVSVSLTDLGRHTMTVGDHHSLGLGPGLLKRKDLTEWLSVFSVF